MSAEIMRVLKTSEKLLEDTLNGDVKSVAAALDWAYTKIAFILTFNNENSLGAAIGLVNYNAREDYRLIRGCQRAWFRGYRIPAAALCQKASLIVS